ncbi:MAG: hypothetical protein OXU35_09240 [Acidobacteriota bacterium]|nr:hypothetical protein [Acidobacteriota bacterium]
MIHTAIRWTLVAVLTPAILLAGSTPAAALLDFLSGPAIIANQITQIAQAVTMIGHLRSSSDRLQQQLTQLREEALGQIGQLTQSIQQLSGDPAKLIDGTVPWTGDFLNPETIQLAGVITDLKDAGANTLTTHWRTALANADQIGETDMLGLFPGHPESGQAAAEALELQRDRIEQQMAADYAAFDAAETLTELIADAQTSLEDLRGQTNLSGTALQQAQMAGQLTGAEIQVAVAQLVGYNTVRDTLHRQRREVERRRYLSRWTDAELDVASRLAAHTATLTANAADLESGLLLPSRHGQ